MKVAQQLINVLYIYSVLKLIHMILHVQKFSSVL
jgi:hypothetical protein